MVNSGLGCIWWKNLAHHTNPKSCEGEHLGTPGLGNHSWQAGTQTTSGQQEACRSKTQTVSALRFTGSVGSLAGLLQAASPICSPQALGSGADGIKAFPQWDWADCWASGPTAVLAACWAVAVLPVPQEVMRGLTMGSAAHGTCHKRHTHSLAGSGSRETTIPLNQDKFLPLFADTDKTFFSLGL